MSSYQVRRVNIGKTTQLDELAHECGLLYSQTVAFCWRTVRHKGIWLKPKHLMRLFTSPKLHTHTANACVQAFFASLTSWRERKKLGDPDAHPPRRRKWYFRVEYKRSAMSLKNGQLRLSNGKGNDPLVLEWPWEVPQTVVIHWAGTQYEAIATYRFEETEARPMGGEIAGIDLGEVHIVVSHDGPSTHILNGRLLRATWQYQNKLKDHLSKKIDRKKKDSKRRQQLIRSKQNQLRKLRNQIKEIEHQQTSRLVSMLYREGVQTVVIGDVRDIWHDNARGSPNNQKIHSGYTAQSATCSPTKLSDLAWQSNCKRNATRVARARSVDIGARASRRAGCSTARTRHAALPGIVTGWERITSGRSIVGNLRSST